ncbi:MAG TPA: hypothetical protein VMD30_00445 [Tepidisphaeraceae bacterium]|nr:hypothetical protein [Tepidisphaeraceae bacterium]
MPNSALEPVTVPEVLAPFWNHAEIDYRDPDATTTPEIDSSPDILVGVRTQPNGVDVF